MQSTVIVGYDGSAAGERALVEAAHQAAQRDLPLNLVFALAPNSSEACIPGSSDPRESRLQTAEEILEDGADLVRYRHPELTVSLSAVSGTVPAVLARAAHDAALLVLGLRGAGGPDSPQGMTTGSVSTRTLAEADGPVLLVHDGEPTRHGRVLAAVDLDGSGDEVLDFAFAEADRRHLPLRVVHIWDDPWALDPGAGTPDADSAVEMDLEDLQLQLEFLTTQWNAKYPDVRATHEVLRGAPVGSVLASASQSADVLVVGAHRHDGGRHGLEIGLDTRRLLRYAACPVAIVPTVRTD